MANSTAKSPSELLHSIHVQRKEAPLSILGLAEPLLTPEAQSQPQSQAPKHAPTSSHTHDPENVALDPSTLGADLAHYRDLFSKLRFSYLEQVTKEKYLRSVVGEPPILATSEQNAALEEKLAVMKQDLQARKRAVEGLVAEIEALARDIAERYDSVNLSVQQLEVLPGEVEALEAEVAELQGQLAEKEGNIDVSDDPQMNLSLEETERLLAQHKTRNEELQREIEGLERDMPSKTRECEKVQRELEELERRRNEITRLARDAQRVREMGGRDLLEEQGRWYQSSEIVLKGLLGVPG